MNPYFKLKDWFKITAVELRTRCQKPRISLRAGAPSSDTRDNIERREYWTKNTSNVPMLSLVV